MADQTPLFIEALSDREREILLAMEAGLSNQEIANSLHLAMTTVKWYNTQIYTKLGVKNRGEAVQQARLLNLLEAAPMGSSGGRPALPSLLTPFVGRYAELRDLDRLLRDPDLRLLTLLAPGGMGKTRLALQVAQQQYHFFRDGVYFVELSALPSPEGILPALAEALELRGFSVAELPRLLLQYLQRQQLLLVLDNFEHLLAGADLLAQLLQQAPGLKLLVTSRERLNLRGETVYTLSGMPGPGPAQENITDFDAARLFVQSVQRLRPDYQPSPEDMPAIADICRLVDGMPLALELAATWMDILSPTRITAEIRASLGFLESDLRDIPARHRSIRATFNRSWERLPPTEQQMMMRLSVFRGGFTESAAEQVAGADIRALKSLVNKALLYRLSGGRYSQHELLRQFCAEHLEAADLYPQTMDAYAHYYADFLERYRSSLLEVAANVIREMLPEAENLARAWQYMVERRAYGLIEKGYSTLWRLYSGTGRTIEGAELLEAAVTMVASAAQDDPALNRLYGELLVNLAIMKSSLLKPQDVEALIRKGIALMEAFGYFEAMIHGYQALCKPFYGNVYGAEGRGIPDLYKALEISQALNRPTQIAHSYYLLALTYLEINEREKAWEMAERSYEVMRAKHIEGENRFEIAYLMGRLLLESGNHAQGLAHLEEALSVAERANWLHGISTVQNYQIQQAAQQGDLLRARQATLSLLRWHQKIGQEWQSIGALYDGYATRYLMTIGEDSAAVAVMAFVHHHPLSVTFYLDRTEALLQRLAGRMEADAYAAAYAQGQQAGFAEIMAQAFDSLEA